MKVLLKSITALCLLSFTASCGTKGGVTVSYYGSTAQGDSVSFFHITNSSGVYLDLTNYGCRIVGIGVPDRHGNIDDVIVGPVDLKTFELGPDRFFGCVLGRYGNRIRNASFCLDGKEYFLDSNENINGVPVHLHGGTEGFDRKLWDVKIIENEYGRGVIMHYLSPDGEQGYPGNCDVTVVYTLTEDNTVRIEYGAQTDAPTIINLSNHAYFNLKGRSAGYVLDHELQVNADQYIQNNRQYCPDLILPVDDTPFDFREPHRIDYRINIPNKHLDIMRGMSACWPVREYDGTLRKAANLQDTSSGREVEVWTTEPALLTYTGRGFNGTIPGKNGPIKQYDAMVLETLHFADSPNQDHFPTTVLRPSEKYHSVTEFRFSAK